MRLVRLFLVVCVVAVAVFSTSAVAAESRITIRRVDYGEFPDVAITAALESDKLLTAEDVIVEEDGSPVAGLVVSPLGEEVPQVDVVLVMDTSGSMEGEPLATGIAAARKFVDRLPPEIRVGVLGFDDKPRILTPITSDHSAALEELSALEAQGETALFDAVASASKMFSGEGQRNIVLLSDGGDTASKSTLRSAASAAKDKHVAVFAVGLRSGEFDAQALRFIAQATNGEYSPVANADLARLYEGLAATLSNQYILTYRSERRSGGDTTLTVRVQGQSESILTLSPSVEAPEARASQVSEPAAIPARPLLRDSWGLVVAIALCFVGVFGVLLLFLGAKQRDERDKELARLMSKEPARRASSNNRNKSGRSLMLIPSALVRLAEGVTSRRGYGEVLDLKLERAGLPLSPAEFFSVSFVAALVGALIGGLILGHFIFVFLSAAGGAMLPNVFLATLARKRFNRLHGQLPDVLMILASSIRSGHSFLQALDMVAKEAGEPGSGEFARLVAEVRLGRPVEEAMRAMGERIGSDDFAWAVLAINVQREVGGNLAELLDGVAETLRERETLRRQVNVLSAEGRLSMYILTALPVVLALYLAKFNPDYLNLLVTTSIGQLMLAAAGSLLILGFLWMKRIVKIDV